MDDSALMNTTAKKYPEKMIDSDFDPYERILILECQQGQLEQQILELSHHMRAQQRLIEQITQHLRSITDFVSTELNERTRRETTSKTNR